METKTENQKVKENKATVKVEKPVREVMRTEDGKRVHLMNINMKNKILGALEWTEGETFTATAKVFNKNKTKYFDRIMEELKVYNINPESKKLTDNHGEITGSRCRYYLLKSDRDTFLVENEKDRTVKRFMIVK